MKTYKELLAEMARDIGRHPYSRIENDRSYPSKKYDETQPHPVVGNLNANTTIHRIDVDGKVRNTVNDNSTRKTLYHSVINTNEPTKSIPFKHISQDEVDRVKDTSVLPKGFATDLIYKHFNEQSLPLKSSSTQYHTGRNMWSRLVDKAHHDGKHVYYFDERGNSEKVTPETKEHHMKQYFGPDDAQFESRNLVLSHTEL